MTRSDLEHLVQSEDHRCVSIYLPTETAGVGTLENPVRLQKLLKEAGQSLERSGLRAHAAGAVLKPAADLIDEYPFWQLQDKALALFISSDFFAGYRLPYSLPARTVVATGFHLKPLLPLLANDDTFLVLAVSRKITRLFRASRYTIEEVPLPDVITSEADALASENREKSLRVHPGRTASTPRQTTAIVHGHGGAREDVKERTLRYFQKMSAGLQNHLKNEKAPLLLAAVDYYLPILREANHYAHLVDDVLPGNPDLTPADELRKAGWKKLEPLFNDARRHSRETVEQGLATGRATDNLGEGVAAAWNGRADKCFVAMDRELWGEFDPQTSAVNSLEPGELRARDLLDMAATQTVLKGGTIYPVANTESVPGAGPLAVLLRY